MYAQYGIESLGLKKKTEKKAQKKVDMVSYMPKVSKINACNLVIS